MAETEASFKFEHGFGGAWFDLPSSRIMVAVTEDAAVDLVARFADRVGAPNVALAVKVENTFEELWSTYVRANTLAASNPDGVLRSVSLDVIANAVKLGVRPPTPAAARAELVAALGPGAKVVDHEEVSVMSLPRPG